MYTCMHAYYNVLASSSNSLILFMQTYGPSNLTGSFYVAFVGGEPFKVGFEFGEETHSYYCTGGPGSIIRQIEGNISGLVMTVNIVFSDPKPQ